MRPFLIILSVVLMLFLAGKAWRILQEKSLARADQLELGATYDRWVEAGRPEGDNLIEFMKGRRPDLTASNFSFAINGVNFATQFALTQSKSGWRGTLFVTTNRVLIWLDSSGQPKLVGKGVTH
jgi:hypothetical protein